MSILTPENVVLTTMEGTYYHLWTMISRSTLKQQVAADGSLPDSVVIPYAMSIAARPVYMQRIGMKHSYVPTVSATEQRFLRPVNSAAMAPNSYLFCGEITAVDRYLHKNDPEPRGFEPGGEWRVHFVVDCGLPLNFYFGLEYPFRGVPHFKAEDAMVGTYVAGMAQLQEGLDLGLQQPVRGTAARMQILGLDPSEEGFGALRDAPYDYRLRLDPDTISCPFVFMTVRVTAVERPRYTPFPNRSPSCPEPVFE